jgi:hypothetical protein
MRRRRRLRRRLLWAGVLLGLVLLYAACSTMRGWFWARNAVVAAVRPQRGGPRGRINQRKGGSMYGKLSLAAVVAATAVALGAPAASADPWAADRHAEAQQAQAATSSYPDRFERFVAGQSIREPVGDDHFRDPPDTAPGSATSGTAVEWPQVGIGLGIGILLAVGLLVGVRLTRPRPLPR